MQLNPAATPQLIDAAKLGEVLALPPASIRRLTREGLLPCYRCGRLLRYDVEQVLAALRRDEGET